MYIFKTYKWIQPLQPWTSPKADFWFWSFLLWIIFLRWSFVLSEWTFVAIDRVSFHLWLLVLKTWWCFEFEPWCRPMIDYAQELLQQQAKHFKSYGLVRLLWTSLLENTLTREFEWLRQAWPSLGPSLCWFRSTIAGKRWFKIFCIVIRLTMGGDSISIIYPPPELRSK